MCGLFRTYNLPLLSFLKLAKIFRPTGWLTFLARIGKKTGFIIAPKYGALIDFIELFIFKAEVKKVSPKRIL